MIKAVAEMQRSGATKRVSLAGELPGEGTEASDQTCHEVTGSEVLTVKEQEKTGIHSWKLLLKTLLCDLKDRINWTNASYVPTLHFSRSKIISL